MNNYYARVNLPDVTTLFNNLDELLNFQNSDPYKIFDKSVLSDIAFNFFKSIKVEPKFIVLFNNPYSPTEGTLPSRLIHSDITLDDTGNWKSLYCGINWEATPNTSSDFCWYDMSALPAIYPTAIPENPVYKILSGIHYGVRNQKGELKDAVLLAQTNLSSATLVRTDIAHTVTYNSPDQPRIGVSIRFEETWSSWEECLKVFKPIIKISD